MGTPRRRSDSWSPRSSRPEPAMPSRARRAGSPRREPAKPETFRVRWATIDDLATLVEHRRKMWREIRRFRPGELEQHDIDYARWVRRQLSARRFRAVLVTGPDGRPLASGALWLMPAQPRPGPLGRATAPYILSMYTERAARGRGFASRIVQEIIAWSKARGYGRITLHASRFGRPVYEGLGFESGNEMRYALRPWGRPSRRSPLTRRPSPREASASGRSAGR